MADQIVGYFCWVRTMKGPAYEKRDKQIYDGKQPETKIALAELTLVTYELKQSDWDLSLEVLAERYPCPKAYLSNDIKRQLPKGVVLTDEQVARSINDGK